MMETVDIVPLWIAKLSISTLSLMRDQRFRGYCILGFTARPETVLDNLSEEEYNQFMFDLRMTSRALRAALHPDHMNYELLGNTHPQLHWHVVPRYKTDPRWGQPIWEGWPRAEFTNNPQLLSNDEYQELILLIRRQLEKDTRVDE